MFCWLFAEKKTDGAADDGPRDLPEPDPALFERANWRPVDEASSSVQRSVQLGATGSSRGRGAPSSSGSCLFDRYGGDTVRTAGRPEGIGANGTTLSARLRASGVLRLMCYVNIDDRGSPAVFVPVPESMRTLKDVLAVIQRIMKLDKRFLYARQLFLPDGELVTSYRALAAAASNDTPVIVGCGEPFNRDGVPQHMVLVHMAGNGRGATKGVKRDFAERRVKAAQLKADQVRAAGHGTQAQAARLARQHALEHNRELASRLRHEQMVGSMRRAAQREEFTATVRAQTARLRATAAQSATKARLKEEDRRSRVAMTHRSPVRSSTARAAPFGALGSGHAGVRERARVGLA